MAKRKHSDTDVPDTTNVDSTPIGVAEKTQGGTLHTSKKARKSKGQTRKESHSDKENDKDDKDALPLIRRKRGRPRKIAHNGSHRWEFLVPVNVETAQDPVLTRGRTHKGDKFVKQPPVTEGPFHLSSKTTWAGFMEDIAKVAKITKEDLGGIISEMKWGFQKKATLPLTDIIGFQTMLQQVRGLKDPESAIIIVRLPASVGRHQRKAHEVVGNHNEVIDNRLDDGSMYGKKVRS